MIEYFKKNILQKDFTKNILILTTGSAIAVVISFLISPLLSRIYAPEVFGLFAVFGTCVAVLAQFITLRYERAIMLVSEDNDIVSLSYLCLFLSVVFSILLAFVVLIFDTLPIFKYFNMQDLYQYRFLIVIVILFTAISSVISVVLNKRKKYKKLSTSSVVLTLSSSFWKVTLGFLKVSSIGLILGHLIGVITNSFYLIISFQKLNLKFAKNNISILAKRFKNFPTYMLVSDTVNTLAKNIHIILLLKYFDAEVVGLVTFASLIVNKPISLISNSFAKVYFQRISELFDNKQLELIHKKALGILFTISLVVIFFGFVLPNQLYTFIFGDEWVDLGKYLPYLVIWFAFSFVSSTVSSIYFKLEKLKFVAVYNILDLALTIAVIYICANCGYSAVETVLYLSLGKAFMCLFYSIYGYFSIRSTDLKKLKV